MTTASLAKPDVADVLAEVNRLRAERDLNPIAELPKGRPCEPFRCPLAAALQVSAVLPATRPEDGRYRVGWVVGARPDYRALPPVLNAFAAAFDERAYPELLA